MLAWRNRGEDLAFDHRHAGVDHVRQILILRPRLRMDRGYPSLRIGLDEIAVVGMVIGMNDEGGEGAAIGVVGPKPSKVAVDEDVSVENEEAVLQQLAAWRSAPAVPSGGSSAQYEISTPKRRPSPKWASMRSARCDTRKSTLVKPWRLANRT